MSEEMAVYIPDTISPAQVIATGSEWAAQLMRVVEERGLFQKIGNKKYLQVEAWELIGSFAEIVPTIEYLNPVYDLNSVLVAYEAKAVLMKDGVIVGSGIMQCGLDEFPTLGKVGYAKDRAAQSAAQTWAISKAFRLRYAWIVQMAGYEPTPAEEMIDNGTTVAPSRPAPRPKQQTLEATPKSEQDAPWCPTHGVQYRLQQKGTRSWWSHPIEGGGWCNPPK